LVRPSWYRKAAANLFWGMTPMAKIREKHEADLGDQGRSVGKTAETEEMLRWAGFGLTSLQELTAGVRFGYSNSDTTLEYERFA
jgi:hypothetical protein